MSSRNNDRYGRFRNKAVAFRVSLEEDERLNRMVDISGLTKQDYLIHCIEQRDYIIDASNPRVHKAVIKQIDYFIELLKRDCHLEDMNIDDIEVLEYLLRLIKGIKQEKRTQIKTEMEPRQ